MMVFLRSAVFNGVLYVLSALACLLIIPFFFLPRAVMNGFSRFWVKTVLLFLKYSVRLDYDCRGWEHIPVGPCLIASKHQSMWDTMALHALLPDADLIAKRELFWIPFFGWGMRKAGVIPVDRGTGAAALRRLLRRARENIRQGRKIVIFPEGTRTAPGQSTDYKPGAAALYRNLDVPCVPVALNSGLFWPRRSFLRRAGRVQVSFLPPIAPGLDRHEFTNKLKQAIEEESLRLAAKIRQ